MLRLNVFGFEYLLSMSSSVDDENAKISCDFDKFPSRIIFDTYSVFMRWLLLFRRANRKREKQEKRKKQKRKKDTDNVMFTYAYIKCMHMHVYK